MYHLSQLLKKQPVPLRPRATFEGIAIIVNDGGLQPFAVVVEEIVKQQRIVNRKLGTELQNIPGLAGAAILGDGKPSLILNLCELVKSQTTDARSNPADKTASKAA